MKMMDLTNDPSTQLTDGWEYGTISSIAEINPKCDTHQLQDEAHVSFIPMQNVSEDGRIISQDRKKYSEVKTGFTCFQEGDVLFAKITPCMENGKGALVRGLINKTGFGSTEFFVLRPKNPESTEFLYQLSRSPMIRHRASSFMTGTAGQQRVSKSIFDLVRIPIPPISEQCRIATILSTVDDAIRRSRQAAAETERLKVGVMQELMTKGIGHTEFREDPYVGTIPNEWEILELGDVCTSNAFGPRFSGSLYSPVGNIAVLRTTDLDQEGTIAYDQMPRAILDSNEFKDHFLKPNDLVITRSGTCGIGATFAGYKIPVLPGAFLIRFRLSSEINPQFLKQYINSAFGKKQISKLECGGVQKNLKGSALLKIKIPNPPQEEQHQITTFLSTIDHKLSLQRQRTAHYEKLKQGLMNDLLTGRKRVKVT